MTVRPGYWRCAVTRCGHEFKPRPRAKEHVCPRCKSADVFPTDDGGWPGEPGYVDSTPCWQCDLDIGHVCGQRRSPTV